jgi:predicted small secreted protein
MKAMMLLVILCVSTMLAACNTMHGLGKDLEAAGEAVQRKSSQ